MLTLAELRGSVGIVWHRSPSGSPAVPRKHKEAADEGAGMRTEAEIRERIAALEDRYDDFDPPSSEFEDTAEVAILRAIEELEWVLEEYDESAEFTTS